MPTGKVKKFYDEKGYGFIQPDDGGDDVFVHRKLCGDGKDRAACLVQGDTVSYEVEWDDGKKKYNATSCTGWKSSGNGEGGFGGGGGRGECNDFKRGACNRGDSCKYSHGDGSSGGRGRSPDRGGYGAMPPAGFDPRFSPYGPYGGMPPGHSPYGGMPPGYGMPSPYGAPPGPYGAPGLPPGWEQAPDPATGRPYYFNRATGQTSWSPPGPPAGPSGAPGGLPPGWEQAPDPATGKPYYFNRATGASSWTPP